MQHHRLDARPASDSAARPPVRPGHANAVVAVWLLIACLAFAGFVALGNWQVDRLAWKRDLIARVDERVHAAAIEAPGRDQWPQISAARDEYRRVRATGTFLHERETLVQATTEFGGGFWVLTPLRQASGDVVLVNRGFVPPERRERATRQQDEPIGDVTVTGLLRITEPGGGFLRDNDPAANRWHSRDVAAIALARGLADAAPYFIDADAGTPQAGPGALRPHADAGAPQGSAGQPAWPRGGLTVIAFHNSHLVYAITWYGLALMVAGAIGYAGREELRLRRRLKRNTLRSDEGHEDAKRD